jgi:DNA-binding Lrp family transcriptional regulator
LSVRLTDFQKRLCNVLQEDLPMCREPFDDPAKYPGTCEKRLLQQTRELKEPGIIRRISALINYRSLGMINTVAANPICKYRQGGKD